MFNELDIQKQITQNQTPKNLPKENIQPKLEIVPESVEQVDPIMFDLLKQENNLVNLMLNFGDVVLHRENEENEKYDITVIEEILHHFEEENYEFQLELNKIIIDSIKEGIQNEELRKGNFFVTFMDENITSKVVDAIMPLNDLENWASRNIFPPNYGDKISSQVEGDILIHKFRYIDYLIKKIGEDLPNQMNNETQYFESIRKITLLKQASMKLSEILGYSPIKGVYMNR